MGRRDADNADDANHADGGDDEGDEDAGGKEGGVDGPAELMSSSILQ